MSKTPYELRLDLLMLAKQSLTEEYHAEHDIYHALIDAAKLTNPSAYTLVQRPKFPSESEVFALAESYKEFIERK